MSRRRNELRNSAKCTVEDAAGRLGGAQEGSGPAKPIRYGTGLFECSDTFWGITPSILNKTLKPYFLKLGIRQGNAHLIRHTLATHLIGAGMPLRYVQELLGHRTLQATLVYVHLAIQDLQKEFRKTHPRERRG